MVHGLETIQKLNDKAIERAHSRCCDSNVRPSAELPNADPPPRASRLEMDFPPMLLKLRSFCEAGARYALEAVSMNFETRTLTATNGRIAARCPFHPPQQEQFSQLGRVLIYGECLEHVANYVEHRRRGILSELPGVGSLKLVCKDDRWFAEDDAVRIVLETCDGKYPDLNLVFGPTGDTVEFSLNVHSLHAFCEAFKDVDNEDAVKFTVYLNGMVQLRAGRYGQVADARLAPMTVDDGSTVRLNRTSLVWRKATAEDCGRLARFRDSDKDGFAYGLLLAVDDFTFRCKFSDNNDIVVSFTECEVQQ